MIFGGALLLAPGFITDIFGALFLLPPTRALVRRLLVRRAALRVDGRRAERAARRAATATPTTSRAPRWTSTPTGWTRRDERAELEAPRTAAARRHRRGDVLVGRRGERAATGLVRVATGIGAAARAASALASRSPGARRCGGGTGAVEPRATVEEPLARWTRAARRAGFALEFEATTPPAELAGRAAVAKAGGLEGYEQLCRVQRDACARTRRPVRGLGQRGHAWGNPDWDKIALTRAVGAWLDDGSGVVITASARRARSRTPTRRSGRPRWTPSARARSTTRGCRPPRTPGPADPRRAGAVGRRGRLPVPRHRRGAGGSTLELGALRLDCAFFRWHSRAGPASAATTSCAARDRGGRLGLRRRADAPLRRVRRHESGRPSAAHGWRSPQREPSRRCSRSSAAISERVPSPSELAEVLGRRSTSTATGQLLAAMQPNEPLLAYYCAASAGSGSPC